MRAVCLLPMLLLPLPARAAEGFVGVFAHTVATGLTKCCAERGVDVHVGGRTGPFGRAFGGEVRAHGFGALNSAGGTDYAALGLNLRFPLGQGRFYVQPGIGAALNNGPRGDYQRTPDRLYLGSRLTFEPELSLGWVLGRRWAAELSWVHLSHAQLAGKQNPGLDSIGLRLVHHFGS